MAKSYEEIAHRIRQGKAVVLTKEEFLKAVDEQGVDRAAETVDVVTTATFGAMCSSGAFLNFGHADPPIKMSRVWLNGVPAYGGLAAVDAYLGATEQSELDPTYGGAHVIEELVAGKRVRLRAVSQGTDCYPRREVETWVSLREVNQAYLFNPRNAYQNYAAATNGSDRTIYTYMGTLLPRYGNVTYSTAGQLSPLLNDPYYRTIGVGTRVFLGGAQGYVAWEGTQHNPAVKRTDQGVPLGGAGTLALIGNLKEMSREYLRAAVFHRYGVTLYVGVGVPIPVLDQDLAAQLAIRDKDILTSVYDYGVPVRSRPALAQVSYAELRSGAVTLQGRRVPTAPLSSLAKARRIAALLREEVRAGRFALNPPVQPLPATTPFRPLTIRQAEGEE
ncbi:MAG: homocysteine biosynthesis protein [Bacillota bacterium]|nr:homocysteine biosynthesis protein [Bacillota bacterium]